MIEPQNSLIPLAAESRPSDALQGDTAGFGEMLAQSLGLVAPVDPTAVQQINSGEDQQNGQSASDDADPRSHSSRRSVASSVIGVVGDTAAQQSATAVGGPFLPAQPVDGAESAPGGKETGPLVRLRIGDGPIRSLPTPPSPVATPDKVDPVDSIWKPGLTAPTENIATPTVVDASDVAAPAPAQAPVQPAVRPEDEPVPQAAAVQSKAPQPVPVDGMDPGSRPPVHADPSVPIGPTISPDLTPVVRESSFVAAPIELRRGIHPQPIARPGTGPRIPPPPSPLGDVAATPPGSAAAGGSSQPPVSSNSLFAARVNLSPDAPAYLGDSQRVGLAPLARNGAEPAASVFTEATAQIDGRHSALAGQAPISSAFTPEAGGDAILAQSSALAERVMHAVDLQRTQPPPRSMVVDIPEVEGLRLVVSVRSGGQVSVTPAIGSTNPDAFAPFTDDLSRVLSDRGFVMTGDGRRRGHNPHTTDEQHPAPRRRQSFRRSAPIDNDLRI